MIKIFEMQQQSNDISNHQCRIVEFESFQDYLQNVNERSLPPQYEIVNKKYVDHKQQTVTFHFLHGINNVWTEFVHFATAISE
jgi:hypothetical protein